MRQQSTGRIIFVSSIAAFTPLPVCVRVGGGGGGYVRVSCLCGGVGGGGGVHISLLHVPYSCKRLLHLVLVCSNLPA